MIDEEFFNDEDGDSISFTMKDYHRPGGLATLIGAIKFPGEEKVKKQRAQQKELLNEEIAKSFSTIKTGISDAKTPSFDVSRNDRSADYSSFGRETELSNINLNTSQIAPNLDDPELLEKSFNMDNSRLEIVR